MSDAGRVTRAAATELGRRSGLLGAASFLCSLLGAWHSHAEPQVTCAALGLGEKWACCRDGEDVLCAPRSGEAALPAAAFSSPASVQRATLPGARDVAVLGDVVCVRTADDRLFCCAISRMARSTWQLMPGIEAVALSAQQGGANAGDAPAFCVILRDQSIACFRVGRQVRKLGVVAGRFHALRVGQSLGCALDDEGNTRCWHLPVAHAASEEGALPSRRMLLASEGAPRDLAIWGDSVCALFAYDRVTCWQGFGQPEPLRVSLAAGAVRYLRLGARLGCVGYYPESIYCWRRGLSIWEGVSMGPTLRDVDQVYLGGREACSASRSGELSCWDAHGRSIPAPASPSVPVLPIVVARRTPAPAQVATGPAERETEWQFHGGIPFSFGGGWYTNRRGTKHGSWFRFRALLTYGPKSSRLVRPDHSIVAGSDRTHAWALGPYYEVAWHPVADSRQFAMGGGVVAMLWIEENVALTPSIGWYEQKHSGEPTEHGISLGIGLDSVLHHLYDELALPVGLRVEGRAALTSGSERAILYSGEADALLAFAVPVGVYMLLTADWSF